MPSNQPEGGREPPPQRRKTAQSDTTTIDSLRRRKTSDTMSSKEVKEKGPFQEHYSCYEGLTWEALKGFLEEKWPRIKLVERKELDQWIFELPERLTEQDRKDIAALRDSNQAPRRRAVTPED